MSPVPNENKDSSADDQPHGDGIEEEHVPHHAIGPIDTDSEDEEEEGEDNFGQDYLYQPLPQEPNGVILENYGVEDASEPFPDFEGFEGQSQGLQGAVEGAFRQQLGADGFGHLPLPSVLEVPELPRPEKEDLLWNQPRAPLTTTLDDDQSEKIRAAMEGFRLPPSHHPDWACEVSDDQWKAQLLSRLHGNITGASRLAASRTTATESSSGQPDAKAEPDG